MKEYADQAVQEATNALSPIASIPHLKQMQDWLAEHIAAMQKMQRAAAVVEMEKIAASVGMKLKALVAIPPGKDPVAVKYRHPDNDAIQWTGRGRQPKWVAAWLAAGPGRTLDDIQVKSQS